MKYTVVWVPSAEHALELLWIAAPDQAAFSSAVNRIDRELMTDPETKGVFHEVFYIIRDFLVVEVYEVIPEDRLVRVVGVNRLA